MQYIYIHKSKHASKHSILLTLQTDKTYSLHIPYNLQSHPSVVIGQLIRAGAGEAMTRCAARSAAGQVGRWGGGGQDRGLRPLGTKLSRGRGGEDRTVLPSPSLPQRHCNAVGVDGVRSVNPVITRHAVSFLPWRVAVGVGR